MSQENVEVVRQALHALDRGEVGGAFSSAAPDAEFDQTRALGMDNRVYTLEEFRQLTEAFISAWKSVHWLADEFIDAGEHVVVPFTNRLTGRDGIEVEAPWDAVVDDPRRKCCAGLPVPAARGGPRSRRVVGVGDVAGECGDLKTGLRISRPSRPVGWCRSLAGSADPEIVLESAIVSRAEGSTYRRPSSTIVSV